MASTKRTWLWVVLGIMGTLALLVVVIVGTAIFEFRRHVQMELVENQTAEQQFNQQRARFAGQQPLIEFTEGQDDRHDRPTVHYPPAGARRVEIQTLRVLIYNFDEGRLIHADVPGWLMRTMRSRRSTFGGDFDMQRTPITIEDIERHGPGLVMEGRNRNSRILVWSE